MKKLKKALKIAMWIAGSILAIFTIYAVISIGSELRYEQRLRAIYNTTPLTSTTQLRFINNNHYRIYDIPSGKYVSPKFDWLSEVPQGDSLAVFAVDNKRGYVNVRTGEVVLDAKYHHAWVFSEGVAAVVKDGRVSIITRTGKPVFDKTFTYIPPRNCNLDYVFHGGYCTMTSDDKYQGLIDQSGEWVLPPIYDQVWSPTVHGYRVVIQNDKYGLLDASLNWAYPIEYDYISYSAEFQGWQLVKDGRMWLEEANGKVVLPFMFEYSKELSYKIERYDNYDYEYQLSHYSSYMVMGRYGIYNHATGKVVTPAIYREVEMLSEHVFKVRTGSNDYILIDTEGKILNR